MPKDFIRARPLREKQDLVKTNYSVSKSYFNDGGSLVRHQSCMRVKRWDSFHSQERDRRSSSQFTLTIMKR